MVVLAQLEIWHSRPVAPTRRVALGTSKLPVDPAPGFGGLLLGGIVADCIGGLDEDLHDDLVRLTRQLQRGDRIPQPRLRHRLQVDLIGLTRSNHRQARLVLAMIVAHYCNSEFFSLKVAQVGHVGVL